MTISRLIRLLITEGSRLAEPVEVEGMPPMTFRCSFSSEGVSSVELADFPYDVPAEVTEFWAISKSARLFEDEQYGQWGLEILDPIGAHELSKKCRLRRPDEYQTSDLVIGRFLGDSDVLVVACDPVAPDYGRVFVALPLDPRAKWYRVAKSFAEFLDTYAATAGEKYWVTQ